MSHLRSRHRSNPFVLCPLLISVCVCAMLCSFFRWSADSGKARAMKRSRSVGFRLVDLKPDPHNANRGTERGRAALERSLREYGAGRAVLIDRHGRIIAGNKTVDQAKRLNIPLRVVKTDGHHLIAVQRNDLDLVTDARARQL